MAEIRFEISMSLDGFVSGPDPGVERPLGEGGERLHEWVTRLASWREQHGLAGGAADPDSELLERSFGAAGAFVMGKRMFDEGEGPWGEEPPFRKPVFVVTHEPRETVTKKGGTSFAFVTEGIESAVEQAHAAAAGKDVLVAGGADVARQCLRLGLLDEMLIHLVPVLLGGGTRLFDDAGGELPELEKTEAIDSVGVTHLRFRVMR